MSNTGRTKPQSLNNEELRCVLRADAFLGEAPYWIADTETLMWLDVIESSVHLFSQLTNSDTSVQLAELCSVVVPRKSGGFIAATSSGFEIINLNTGALSPFAKPAESLANRRFNDGKCDPQGRFWAGTLALDGVPGMDCLYCLNVDGSIRLVEQGFHACNGIGWSPDGGIIYVTDSGSRVIFKYDFDSTTGDLCNKRTFVQMGEKDGVPDGLAVDEDGYIWSAVWDGWRIIRFNPDGHIDRIVHAPVPRPTSCAFGGVDLKTLFVTSARNRLPAAELAAAPMSGSIFALDVSVPGTPVNEYHG